MKKEPILISACLLGAPCRYDGRSKPCNAVNELQRTYDLIPVCPEALGGLPTPRPPAEVMPNGLIVNREGTDVTAQYRAGAEAALRIARQHGCRYAVLKEKSPSCGKGRIYDGSFTGTLIDGDGVTVRLLKENGIRIIGESELASLKTD